MPKVVIAGAGLVGALNACFFAKRGWHVEVYEARQDIRQAAVVRGRSINLALSTRGEEALAAVGLRDRIVAEGVAMFARLVHEPSGAISHRLPYGKPHQRIISINRRHLNEVLISEAESFESVKFYFGHKLRDSRLNDNELEFLRLSDETKVVANGDLFCGCDGAHSALRKSLMSYPNFDFSQQYIEHGYIELNIQPTETNEFAMEPNVFHLWPRGKFVMIALANIDKTFTVTLFAPYEIFESLRLRATVLKFFDETFPDALDLIGRENVAETFATIRASPLFTVKSKPHHFGGSAVLLGDAAHAMVPFYGQGMNCGFEDCLVLSEMFDKHNDDIAAALRDYSADRCVDAHAACDLALYNYLELRDLVNKRHFRIRKELDKWLNARLPRLWMPLYSMVTFSRTRYNRALLNKQRQDSTIKVVLTVAAMALFIAVIAIVFAFVF